MKIRELMKKILCSCVHEDMWWCADFRDFKITEKLNNLIGKQNYIYLEYLAIWCLNCFVRIICCS